MNLVAIISKKILKKKTIYSVWELYPEIAQKLSGFTAGQADLLRRAMGKKKRAELGPNKTFTWRGKQYNTNREDD